MNSFLARFAVWLTALGFSLGLWAQGTADDPAKPVVTLTLGAPADGESFALGAEIPIRATAVDSGGAITRLEFLADGQVIGVSEIFTLVPIAPGTPVQHEWIWKDAPFGSHELRVRGQGSPNEVSVSAPVRIQVGQIKPVASLVLIRPTAGERLRVGQAAELVAEATDPRGLIETVEFFANGERVGTSAVNFCPPCEAEPCPLRPCALPVAGTTLTHRVEWKPEIAGEVILDARTVFADGTVLKSEAVSVAVATALPTVTVTTGQPYALEGDRMNRGEILLERTGDLSRELTVFFGITGAARRGVDYRLVVNPCDDCAQPDVELTGDAVTFPAGQAKLTLGVFASWDGLLTVVESPVETLRFEVYTPPIPAVVGAEPPYLAGNPAAADLWVVDRRSPEVAEVMLIAPEARAELALGSAHTLRALAVDPVGSIRRVEFLAGGADIGVSQIVTREADIPGRLRVHELVWKPTADGGSPEVLLQARATDAAGKLLESWPVPVKLTDPTANLPVLTLGPGKTPAYETGDLKSRTGSVILRRSGGETSAAAVDCWLQVTGSAAVGADYVWTFIGAETVVTPMSAAVFLPVTIPAGVAERELSFEAVGDVLSEGAETVVVRLVESPLQTVSGGLVPVPPTYRIGEPAAATVEIWDRVLVPVQVVLTVDGTEFPAGATVNLSATATVPGFAVGGIVFLANGRPIGEVPYCCDTCRCVPPVEGAPFSATFAWTNPPAGTYRLTAQALTFANNLWESEPVTIRVGELKRPTLAIVAPTNGTALKLGGTVVIDTVGVDPQGFVNTVEFFANGLKIGETCLACVIDAILPPGAPLHNQISWTPVLPGSVVLTAVGHFSSGQTVAAGPVVVRVGEQVVPTLAITAPLNGASFRVGETVSVEAVGQHPDGWITTVEFFANGEKVGESCLACLMAGFIPPGRELANRIDWQPAKPGAYTLTAVGLCSNGEKVATVPVNVRVLDGQAGTLTITFPADGTKVGADAPVEVTVAGTDRVGGFTDVALLVDGVPAAESHIRFIRAPGADETVVHAFTVRLAAGTHELVAQDLTDRSVKSPPIRVTAEGEVARIHWKSPANGARFPAGQPIVLEVTAVQPGGILAEVEFLADGAVIGKSVFSCPNCLPVPGAEVRHQLVWSEPPVGTHQLTARALRADGTAVKSDTLVLTVDDPTVGRLVVRRDLPETYSAGVPFSVRLVATPSPTVAAWVVEETPPFALPTPGAAGLNGPFWHVTNVGVGGTFDATTGKVKFGPFFDREPRVLTYDLVPNQVVEVAEFTGLGSADGASSPIVGDRLLRGLRRHPADLNPADNAISANELTAYAAAWKREQTWPVAPNPIPMDYVTRAAALWKAGESYREVAVAGSARDWANGLPTAPAEADANILPLAGTALRSRAVLASRPGSVTVSYRVYPAPGSRAFALEEILPEGIAPTDISAGGTWSPASRTLRWGPFFAGNRPDISFVASADPGRLTGRVSFDGLSLPIHEAAAPATPSGRLIAVDPLPDGTVQISLEADALMEGGEFDLEISGDLSTWSPVGGFAPENTAGFVKDSGPSGAQVRFYRAVRRK